MMKKLLYSLLLLVCITGFSQNEALFEQGKEFYKNGKYQQAVQSWKKILDNGMASPELYFNLGNAEYKQNHIGPSIYYYEKALKLAPNDRDIKTNLTFAENTKIDIIEPLPKSVFTKWNDFVMDIFSYDGWAIIAVVFSLLFLISFLLYYFSYSERKKRLLFATSMLEMVIMIAAISMAFISYNDHQKDKSAIIFAGQIEVKSEPTMGSNSTFLLHEGTKVKITGQDGNWYRIILADGKDGWVPATDLKQL